ncbi:MAG: hypothetical protein RI911_609 [Candidatus Parcubacteria bacterium]|jgi:hypothetical protein
MMTPTHVFLNWALLGQRKETAEERWAIIAGALFPDIGVWVFTAWFFSQYGFTFDDAIWDPLYDSTLVNAVFCMLHSFIVWPLLLIVGLYFRNRIIAFFAGSALLHSFVDFLVHAQDAYAHFIPLSWWRFHSPISYWDPSHFGNIIAPIDSAIGFCALIYIYPRVTSWWGRAVCLLFAALFLFHTAQRIFFPFGGDIS